MSGLSEAFENQRFSNGYELVDGVAKHEEYGAQFQIPPPVIKQQLRAGHFVELRVDSERFSMHQDDAEQCACPSCNGEFHKPILRHEEPETLAQRPDQAVPSRGWGEDFWVQIEEQDAGFYVGRVDNRLVESKLHEIEFNDRINFREEHILAVHGSHRQELVLGLTVPELKKLAAWVGQARRVAAIRSA